LWEEMERDERVFLLGEDIADPFGGSYKVTLGLSSEFGVERVRNTPISEMAIVGSGIGAAIQGMRPIVEIMYEDFLTLSMEQLVNQAAKHRTMSGGPKRGAALASRSQRCAGLRVRYEDGPALSVHWGLFRGRWRRPLTSAKHQSAGANAGRAGPEEGRRGFAGRRRREGRGSLQGPW
ncbi:MAG: hypothetical protein K6T59_02140, partial [Bryobacteraceae bacterium]|nr:hypothetical protein [Bryobacteraceae bacterium]